MKFAIIIAAFFAAINSSPLPAPVADPKPWKNCPNIPGKRKCAAGWYRGECRCP
jgi:hypothetical protein